MGKSQQGSSPSAVEFWDRTMDLLADIAVKLETTADMINSSQRDTEIPENDIYSEEITASLFYISNHMSTIHSEAKLEGTEYLIKTPKFN